MVVKLGVEIELASVKTDDTERLLHSGLNWMCTHDGSINIDYSEQEKTEFRTTTPYTVDLNDIDGSVNRIADDYKKILDTLERVTVNSSMGIHFHFSGIKKWSVFFSKDFFDMVLNRYLAICTNATERERVHNRYCAFNYSSTSGDRYRAINILGAFERHKTFEFRFFASTDKISVFKRYVRFVLEILKEVKETEYELIKKAVSCSDEKTMEEKILFV